MSMTRRAGAAVTMISWPTQQNRRDWCRDRRIPRILVVEPGQSPPTVIDLFEDWVRAPLPQGDLDVRVATLERRHQRYNRPALDADGVLVYRGRRVVPSPSQAALLSCLIDSFERAVERGELMGSLGVELDPEDTRRNLLDLHIGRLRRKLKPLGLGLRTVWGSGYVLEPLDALGETAWSMDGGVG